MLDARRIRVLDLNLSWAQDCEMRRDQGSRSFATRLYSSYYFGGSIDDIDHVSMIILRVSNVGLDVYGIEDIRAACSPLKSKIA